METLVTKNPATGETLKEIPVTPIADLSRIFETARTAQKEWASIRPRKRAKYLLNFRESIINHLDELVDLISAENGKPKFESMSTELLPTVQLITHFAKKGPKILKNRRIALDFVKHRKSYVNFYPMGVVAVISPWNFPFFLPLGEIVLALIAGNAVVFKPSEVTPLIGLKIQELLEESGLPPGLVQTVVGDGKLGAAMIDQKPAKIFFTGSAATGKKVMQSAAKHMIPTVLELGGKNSLIVCPDADVEYATSAALWGCFANSGQVCASHERLLLHENMQAAFLDRFKEKIGALRKAGSSNDGSVDLGAVTYETQKDIYKDHLNDAKNKGAEFVTGGALYGEDRFMSPTVIKSNQVEDLKLYHEESFGPIVAVDTYKSLNDAIEKANDTPYGLSASVITNNNSHGEEIAKKLEVGTVNVNEVIYSAGLAEAPWGGVKQSGVGRKQSDFGLLEHVHIRHINRPRFSLLNRIKSLWWYPYSPYQNAMFKNLFELYRKSWFARIKAVPEILWNAVQSIKKEPRI